MVFLSPSRQKLGFLFAFQVLPLHSRHDTMGATVSELWLCLSPTRQNDGPIACLMGATVSESWVCSSLSRQNDGPNYRPILDTSAWRLACCHHSCSARYCNVRPSTGGQPVYVFRFAVITLIRFDCSYTHHALLNIAQITVTSQCH